MLIDEEIRRQYRDGSLTVGTVRRAVATGLGVDEEAIKKVVNATLILGTPRRYLLDQVRAELQALHPDSRLEVLSVDRVDRVVLRCSHQGHSVVAVHNVTASRLTFDPTLLGGRDDVVWLDRLTDQRFVPRRRHALEPYSVLWLVQP